MKNVSRLIARCCCFRPANIETELVKKDHFPGNPSYHYAKITDMTPSLSEGSSILEELNDLKRPKRAIARIFRAVVFRSSLRRSAREKRTRVLMKIKTFESFNASKLESEEKSSLPKSHSSSSIRTDSDFSSKDQSASLLSGARLAIYAFMICLCVIVAWGRGCTMLLTAMCLFVVPFKRKSFRDVRLPARNVSGGHDEGTLIQSIL